MRKYIALLSLIAILALVNATIIGKEKHLAKGTVVYLELAPVDPRSLMQGDYMALRFRMANEIYNALPKENENATRWRHDTDAGDVDVIVSLDENNIGSFRQIHTDQALQENEIMLHYRVRADTVKLPPMPSSSRRVMENITKPHASDASAWIAKASYCLRPCTKRT